MNGPFYFIVDGAEGGARRLWPYFEARLKKAGAEYRWRAAASPEDVARLCERIGDEWIPVAVGGDGALQALAAAVAPGRTIAHLPAGGPCDFARSIGISRSPGKALAQLLSGRARPVDLPAVNGRPFLGVAGAAFGGLAAFFGLPAARRSAFSALIALASPRARHREIAITVDGKTQKGKTFLVAVGNGRFFGGLDVCPLAHPDDGLLDLCVTDELSARESLLALGRMRRGTHVRHPKVHYTKAHHIAIDGPPQTRIVADGRAVAVLPASVELHQHALKVIVPREAWNPSKVTSILRRRPGTLDNGTQG